MWNTLEVRNNLTKTIAKKMALVLFAVAITLVTVGCAPKAVEVIEGSTNPISDVNKEPTSPSKPSPETPPATPVETKTAIEKVFDLTPNVEGLTKKILDEQVVYLADADNLYNLESGVYAGFYKENVEVEGVKTGGICLLPEVVLNLVRKDTSKIVIPVGVENNEENAPLLISNINKEGVSTDMIYVKSNTSMQIVGSCPTDESIPYYALTYKERKDYFSKIAGDVSFRALWMVNGFKNEITSDTKSFFQGYFLSECNMEIGTRIYSNYGEILSTNQVVAITCKEIILYTGDSDTFLSSTVKDLLMIEDKPVFMNTIQSRTE
ncbi:hypothetical protein SDC9_82391 [bioreactor metagenome]|uniref:Uncharacterized protein n=1 Tax=bioreactor metagenome TaxID=1076179 RepID=A0A644Z5A8_9ZZZZ